MGADLTYVMRSLRRRPGFTATVIATLSLGLGLIAGVFSFADGYLFRPLPFPASEQLYRVRDPQARIALLQTDTIALRQTAVGTFGFVEWSAGRRISGRGIVIDGRSVPVWPFDVSPGFADALKLPLVAGRTFTAADHSARTEIPVWLSHRFWNREFGGDVGVLGRSFPIDGQDAATVVVIGILSPDIASFDLNNRPPDLVAPALQAAAAAAPNNRLSFPIVRLPHGITREEGESRIAAALTSVAPGPDGAARRIELRPLRAAQVAGGAPTARVLLAGAVLILLLAAMNLVHLLLAQSVARSREISTRAALGATRWRVTRLFLLEGLVLGLPGIAGGLLSGWCLSELIASRIPEYPTVGRNLALVPMAFDARVISAAVIIGLVVAGVSALWPAWRANRGSRNPAHHLGRVVMAGLPRRISRIVLASQLAVATTLLLGTVFIGMGIWRYLNPPLGYSYEDRVVIWVDAQVKEPANWEAARAALAAIPGVRAAGAYHLREGNPIAIGREPQAHLRAYDVSDGYFDVWQVRLSKGRWFSADEYRSDAAVAMVDVAMAGRLWPGGNALGQDLHVGTDPPRKVVGIVDTQVRSLRNPPAGEAYVPRTRPGEWLPLVAWAPGISASMLERRMEPVISAIVPTPVLRAEPVTKTWLFNRETGEAEFQGPVMVAFALLTFVVSGVGIFGLVSYLIAQRTREFGIRLALGASDRNIWRIVLRESLVPSLAGLLAGVFAARLLEGYVRSSVFGWQASVASATGIVAAAVLGLAIVAALPPARRAMRTDPAAALRAE